MERWTGKCVVDNRDMKLKLHIVEDVTGYLDRSKVPSNIEIVEVETIDEGCVELDMDVYD